MSADSQVWIGGIVGLDRRLRNYQNDGGMK